MRKSREVLAFLAPSLVCLALVNFYPLVFGVWISFYRRPLFSAQFVFAGLRNYSRILQDPTFYVAFWNTILFTIGTVVGSYVIGLVLALLLNGKILFRGFFRSAILLPWVMPSIVVAYTWGYIYHDLFGILNYLLTSVGITKKPILWLANPKIVLWSLTIVNIWKAYPYMMTVLLAGLQSIPSSLYEAAAIDGASSWQQFTRITLPLLKPLTLVSTMYMFIWTFNYFDLVYLMTGGGPGHASHVLATYAYEQAFAVGDYGRASAVAVIMLIVLYILITLYIRSYRGVEADSVA
jgi:ABC-type sugar transport systems, permease components